MKKCIALKCKSLWIKASAKYINVNAIQEYAPWLDAVACFGHKDPPKGNVDTCQFQQLAGKVDKPTCSFNSCYKHPEKPHKTDPENAHILFTAEIV